MPAIEKYTRTEAKNVQKSLESNIAERKIWAIAEKKSS